MLRYTPLVFAAWRSVKFHPLEAVFNYFTKNNVNKFIRPTTNCAAVITGTRNPAVARKSRPYRLRPKPSVRLPIKEWKRFLEMTEFHARYVKGTMLSKATTNASITHVARGDMRSSRQAIQTATVVNNQQRYRTQV